MESVFILRAKVGAARIALLGTLVVPFLALSSLADLEGEQTAPLAPVIGDDLKEFLFEETTESNFALRDLEDGSEGYFRVLRDKVQLKWRVSIDERVFVLRDVEFCATPSLDIECFRLFKPAVSNAKCSYYLSRRKGGYAACLTRK